ncbi:hypothetical protein VPH35_136943 [Triticum aestivum]
MWHKICQCELNYYVIMMAASATLPYLWQFFVLLSSVGSLILLTPEARVFGSIKGFSFTIKQNQQDHKVWISIPANGDWKKREMLGTHYSWQSLSDESKC